MSEFIESSLKALFSPARVYGELAAQPEPSYGAGAANLLFWSALAMLLNVVGAFMRFPDGMGFGVPALLAACAAGAATALAASLPAAALLHAAAVLSGGSGSFRRSYQALSTLSALAPLSAAFLWLPSWLWILPTLYGAWLAVHAVSRLHAAPSAQAWAVVGSLGAMLAAGQIAVRGAVNRLQQDFEARINLSGSTAGPASVPTQELPEQSVQAAVGAMRSASEALARVGAALDAEEGRAPSSGLDMIRMDGKGGSFPEPPGPASGSPLSRPNEQLRQMSLGMLEQMNRTIGDERALRRMSPEQAAQVRQALKAANEISAEVRRGGQIKDRTPQEQEEFIRRMSQVMGAFQQQIAAPQAPRVRRRKVRPPE